MRRFSQRQALVTLSDINLTPLIDLAWTLLIIFMITAPLLTPTIEVELPEGGTPPTHVNRQDLRTISIDAQGHYLLNQSPVTIEALEQQLVREFQNNPNLVVRIQADERGTLKTFYPVIDRLTKNGITRLSLATRPEGR